MEGQLLQFYSQVDIVDHDLRRRSQRDGSEIEDAQDPRTGKLLGNLLCSIGGNSEDGQARVGLMDRLFQFLERQDGQRRQAGDGLIDLPGILIEGGDYPKPFTGETAIACQGIAQIAGANQQHIPELICTEDLADRGDHAGDTVAFARLAELAEIAEILANLSIGKAERIGQLLARDGQQTTGMEGFELGEDRG